MKRLNLELSNEAYQVIEKLRKKRGTSRAEILRSAVALLQYVEQQKEEGKQIIVVYDGDIEKEIVW